MIPVPIIENVSAWLNGHVEVMFPGEIEIQAPRRKWWRGASVGVIECDVHVLSYRMVDGDPTRLEPYRLVGHVDDM